MAYNGHPTWSKWNVSLWLLNDEGLYNLARRHVRRASTKDEAATAILTELNELGSTATPDGTTYRIGNIRHAIRGDF